MHKFSNRSYDEIFRYEHTQSTPLDPKLMVLGHFGPFHYCTKLDAKLVWIAPLTHKFAKWCCNSFFHNERNWSTPLDPKLMFWGILDRFITARNSMQNWPNWHHEHKFAKRSCVGSFPNERTWSTPLDPKHMFWHVSLVHESRCKTGQTGAFSAQVLLQKLRRNFSQRTNPIHSIGHKLIFWGVSDRFVTAWNSMQNWPN
jgi:hypothetical protein